MAGPPIRMLIVILWHMSIRLFLELPNSASAANMSWNIIILLLFFITNGYTQVVSASVQAVFAPDENPRYFPVGIFAKGESDGSFSVG